MKRQRAARRTLVAVLMFGSAAAHAALVAVVDVRSVKGVAGSRPPEPVAPDWSFTCAADAELAAALRLAACATPFGGPRDACARDAAARLDAARARCDAAEEVEIAFVDVDDLDLMPVPLLEDVAPTPDTEAARLIEEEVAQKLEQAAKPLQTPTPTGQIVEIARPDVEAPPDQARYLSEYDSKVDQQTVARGSTEEMVARPAPEELRAAAEPPPTPPDAAAPPSAGRPGQPGQPNPGPSMLTMREERPGAETPRPVTPGLPADLRGLDQPTLDGLEPRRGPSGEPAPVAGQRGGPEGGQGGEGASALALRPSEQLLERAVGGGSVDRIDDAEAGEFTALNSRKWKFAGFFNRMKRQVAQNWHPDDVYLRRDPSGNVYGTRDRVTILQVSLTPNGQLSKVFVAQQSGVDFLDDEAIRAFHEAQPFPNPPAGLVDSRSNTITFSFGFHFQIGADRSSWRVFRAN